MKQPNPPYVHKDLRIEFLRILAMLLIVACHGMIHLNLYQQNTSGIDFSHLSLSFSNIVKLSVVQFGQVGVVIFFMITGYFLYERAFSWRRIGTVYVQMWLYSVLIFTGFAILQHVVSSEILDRLFDKDHVLTTVLGTFLPFSYRSYWFISAYIVLLLFTPFLNIFIHNAKMREQRNLIFLLFFTHLLLLAFLKNYYWNNVILAITSYLMGAYLSERVNVDSTMKQNESKQNRKIALLACAASLATLAFYAVILLPLPVVKVLQWDQLVHNGAMILSVLRS